MIIRSDDKDQIDLGPIHADRRGFLKCMTWAGTAMVWTVAGGIPRSHLIGQAEASEQAFTFAQVSDSHLGFNKPVNPDVTATFQDGVERCHGDAGKARLPDPHR